MTKVITLLILLFTVSSASAQTYWKEQPVAFAVGIGIGIGTGKKERSVAPIMILTAVTKTAWDVDRGRQPDPFTACFGVWIGTFTIRELSARTQKNKQ